MRYSLVIKKSLAVKRLLITLCFSLLGFVYSYGQTSWIGVTSTSWRTASNWTSGIPDATTDVIIGDASFTGAFQPSLPNGKGSGICKSLTIGTGAKASVLSVTDGADVFGTLTIGALGTIIDNGGNLRVQGDWLNSGTYTPTSTNRRVYLTGTTQSIGGTSITTFAKLYINSGSTVTLANDVVISNFIDLSGTLNPTQNFQVSGAGDIKIVAGGVLKVMAATLAGNYSITGSINPSKTSSVIEYAASAINQSIDNSIDYQVLLISGGMVKSLTANTTIKNELLINGGTLDLLTFTADRNTTGGSLILASGAALKIGGTNTFPDKYSTHTLATTSTVNYYGANQTVAAESYGNLILSSASGAIVKTMPTSALTVAGNFTSSVSAGSLAFTAGNNVTVSGNITLGAASTFNGATFSHATNGNWINNGTYNGCSATLSLNGAGATMSGSGTNNFGDLVITGSETIMDQNTSVSVCGNFSTSGGGSFTHTAGGTGDFTMTGAAKTISGASISFSDFNISGAGSISTSSSFAITGDFVADGPLTASAGTIDFCGTAKTISGSAALQFAALTVTGTLSTARDLSISSNVNVTGSFTATAGTVSFNGTSTLSGTANIYNVLIAGASTLTMGTNATLGIAGAVTATGTFDPTSNTPNTVNYNSTGAQSLVFTSFSNLIVSNGNTKTPPSGLTVNGNFTIGAATTFPAGTFTHSVAGDWINNGTFTASTSTIVLSGTSDASVTGATTFNNLTVNKGASNLVTLINDVNVTNLAMTAGNMNTGANSITITATRTGPGTIIGTITRTHAYTTATNYDFEGADNFINFSAITGSITSITVVVATTPNATFPAAASINRTYDITVTGSSTYTADMRLHYEQTEINGNVETAMTFWNDGGTGTWTEIKEQELPLPPLYSYNSTANWVNRTTITDLSNKWTISEGLIKYSWTGLINNSWAETNNWSPAGVPTFQDVAHLGDTLFINQPTIGTIETVKKVYFNATTATTLSLSGGGSLAVQGNIDGSWSADAIHTINVGSQTLTTLSDIVLSDGVANRRIDLTVSTGSVNISGSLTQTGGADITFTDAGTMTIGGNYTYVSGTLTPSTSTITYNGVTTQQIAGVTYNDLVIDKVAGSASMLSPVTVNNDFTLSTGGQLDVSTTLSVTGNLTIGASTVLNVPSTDIINVGGNWVESGTFTPGLGTVVFNGTGAQTTEPTTFDNLTINKASGTLTLLGDLGVNGDIDVQSGTVEVSTYDVTRSTTGGTATLGAGSFVLFGGTSIQMNNFASLVTDPTSTIEFYTTAVRIIPPIAYGNLIITNGGANAKTMVAATTVNGDLTVNSGATLTAPPTTLTLGGDFTMDGTFNASGGTVILDGNTKNINGNITYNDMVVNGSYDIQTGTSTFDGAIDITATGDLGMGTGLVILNDDFTNAGIVSSEGTVTFTGTTVQTIRLLNAITSSSTGTLNFDGTFASVFNSTSSPQFGTVNINNTAGVTASQPWFVYDAINIASGATFYAGALNHTFYGDFANSGTLNNSGKLLFSPTTAVTVDLGTSTVSTGEIEFGGAGLITLTDNNQLFESVTISNTNAAGITPATSWTVAQDMTIQPGAQLNGGALSHTVSGKWTNSGTFNGQTSTVTFDSNLGTDAITGLGANNFYNLIFDAGTSMDVVADVYVSADFTNNATALNMVNQSFIFNGTGLSVLGGATTTDFNDLEIDKTGNSLRLDLAANVNGFLTLTDGSLDLNSLTLSVTNPDGAAIERTSGYILSENTSFNSVLSWAIGTDVTSHVFPFGTSSGDYIPFTFVLNSGDAGTVSVATYGTGADNLPLPPTITELNDEFGADNSANTVDRFHSINLAGETTPDVDVTFSASATEVGTIATLRAQRWNSEWEPALTGQVSGATSVLVPGITQFSPWAISGNSTPLPVELTDFSAHQKGDNVILAWETSSEHNNDYFEIQKSIDGKKFFSLGQVKGAGDTTTPESYSFKDKSISTGHSYYRLKQVDFDGASSLSKTVLVNVKTDKFKLSIYPNPTASYFNIVSNIAFDQEFTVTLHDQVGNVVLEETRSQVAAFENVQIDVNVLPSGSYVLQIMSEDITQSYKVMVK
jgi:fibronectin-binding autotransporter adhesin